MKDFIPAALFALGLAAAAPATSAFADSVPAGWKAENMAPVGFLGIEDRYAYKMAIKQYKGKWYIFTGYARKDPLPGQLVIIDVTDPANMKRVKKIDGPADNDMGQVSLHGDLLITSMARALTVYDTTHAINFMSEYQPETPPAGKSPNEGIKLWDVSDPTNPKELSHWETGAFGTHRNVYPGGKYAFLSASAPGYRGMILVVLDVSDPKHPKKVGQWAQFGQKPGEERDDHLIPSFHGPAMVSPDGKTLIVGFTPDVVNLDISDITQPKLIGKVQMIGPFAYNVMQSVHTVIPYWDKKILYVSGEPKLANCKEPLPLMAMVDNSDPKAPMMMSVFPTPRPPADSPWKNFCEKPGRLGPHNVNTEIHNPDVAPPSDLLHVAYFTAGMRVFDIKDPRLPTEVGWFLPAEPDHPTRSQSGMLQTSISQETLTDARGNIFLMESGGLWALKDTGALAGRK